jgi:hypothetical protein
MMSPWKDILGSDGIGTDILDTVKVGAGETVVVGEGKPVA